MNYQKLDAPLTVALNNVQDLEKPSLAVFIYTEPVSDPVVTNFLTSLGISGMRNDQNLFTATLSSNAVSQLSEQPWVKYLKLSQKLHLLNSTKGIRRLGV
ncbi:MAG: hypothetical protein PUP90_12310 [Nostoc sp. S4]|nr:hypothetical protein [Nostoc sp. S4]